MSDMLIRQAKMVTFDQNNPFIQKGDILVQNGKICEVSTQIDVPESKNIQVLELSEDYLVFPGFINAHNHVYSALARGIPIKTPPPVNFSQVLNSLWWRLDKALDEEALYYSACLAMMDALSGGTTFIIDHHSSPSFIPGSLDVLERVAKQFGVSMNLCYEVSDRDGPEAVQQGIDENIRIIEQAQSADFSALFGLHASFTLSDDTLKKVSEYVQKYDTGVHIHLCEDRIDLHDSLKKYGLSPVQRLDKFGLLNEKAVLVHGVHLIEEDYAIMHKNNISLIHNSRSNMNNAVGCCDLPRLFEENITVGLGTDGMSSSLLPDISTAVWLHKHHTGDPAYGFGEVMQMLSMNNPEIVEKIAQRRTGLIAPGYCGDFAVFHYPSPTPVNKDNWLGHLVFSLSGEKPVYTISDGKIRYDHGSFPGIELSDFAAQCREVTRKLWERF